MPLYRCAHACGHWTVVCSLLHTKIGPFREMASLLILFKILYIVTGVSPGGSLPTHRNQNKTNVRFLPLERLALASSIFSLLSPLSKQPSCFKTDFIFLVKIVCKWIWMDIETGLNHQVSILVGFCLKVLSLIYKVTNRLCVSLWLVGKRTF